MPKQHLAIYLKDHLAGSEAGLAILEHIEAAHGVGRIADITTRIRREIEGERKVLARLLDQLDASTSAPRRVAGWMSEKMLELKLVVDDPGDGALRLFEAAEAIKLGVHGKLGLWKALQANAQDHPVLATVDYEPLIRQAEEQEALLEMLRMEASRAAFAERA
ncbi:MAG TPA: hypothetical protein VGJ12_02790 [Gemmatimonadaceae bacterium]